MKISQYFQDKEEERLEGEEQFMHEPTEKVYTLSQNPTDETPVEGIHSRSTMSQRALDQLDYSSANPNPLE